MMLGVRRNGDFWRYREKCNVSSLLNKTRCQVKSLGCGADIVVD